MLGGVMVVGITFLPIKRKCHDRFENCADVEVKWESFIFLVFNPFGICLGGQFYVILHHRFM